VKSSHTVAVRVPDADYRDLVRAALAARVTVSEYVRRCVAAQVEDDAGPPRTAIGAIEETCDRVAFRVTL
jgi:hypothetical protein